MMKNIPLTFSLPVFSESLGKLKDAMKRPRSGEDKGKKENNDNCCLPFFNIFFSDDDDNWLSQSVKSLSYIDYDFNYRYFFLKSDRFSPFLGGGLNYTHLFWDYKNPIIADYVMGDMIRRRLKNLRMIFSGMNGVLQHLWNFHLNYNLADRLLANHQRFYRDLKYYKDQKIF